MKKKIENIVPEMTPEEMKKRKEVLEEFSSKRTDYPQAWNECYNACRADEDFVLVGTQLTPQLAKQYGFGKNFQMPNLLKAYINNQANQTLENDYRAVVSPNGGGADIGKARLREQALRGIQRVGGAAEVYNLARRFQLGAGIHYSKVVVDYANYRGMEQEYTFEDVEDTYNVFPDPLVHKATFSDMNDFLIKEAVPKSLWKKKTGKDWSHGSEKTHDIWYYWRKAQVLSDKEYLDAETGEGVFESQLPMRDDGQPDITTVKIGEDGSPFYRDVKKFAWEWYVIDDNLNEIYSDGKWEGQCSPLVACTGEKIVKRDANGVKVFYRSLAYDAKEPQMVYTICENLILLQRAKSPYPHYEIDEGSIVLKQLEEYRQNAVIGDNDVLYRSSDGSGKTFLKPNYVKADGVDPQLIELQQVQIQKIERILGIYDSALGQKTNEKSGVAIKERAKQSNLANYHFEFNFIEYVKQLGYVVLESLPHYFTQQQIIPMVDNEDKTVMQEINGPDGIVFGQDERYRMVIEVVPDSDSSREAEAKMLMDMAGSEFIGSIIAKTPGAAAKVIKAQKGRYAQELGDMIERASEDPEKKQMGERIQQMQAEGKKLQDELAQLRADKQLDAVKERNRHEEAMRKIEAEIASNADKNDIEAFNAATKREPFDGYAVPQQIVLEGAA